MNSNITRKRRKFDISTVRYIITNNKGRIKKNSIVFSLIKIPLSEQMMIFTTASLTKDTSAHVSSSSTTRTETV